MHVGKNNPHFEYYMAGIKLKVVEEEKDIGMTIHKSLKPSAHCKRRTQQTHSYVSQRKNFTFGIGMSSRNYMSIVQYVRPHVEFASPAWSPWNEADKIVIEKKPIVEKIGRNKNTLL